MRRFRVFSVPQIYWHVLKKRLKDKGNVIVTNCNDLKLTVPNDKNA